MSKKMYVGNLSYKVDDDILREAFEKIGEVQSAKVITDHVTGRSRGFGFVEMPSDEDAERAIAELNGTALLDREIIVNEARPQTDRRRSGGGGKQHGPAGKGKGFGSWR
jgi:RNA recognition motif-containing protein